MDRFENRHNRIIPALLCPWEQNTPIVSKAVVAITKDFSDRGVGLILSNTFDAQNVVVGFCHQEATAKEAKSQEAKATVSKAEEAKVKESKPQESKSKESGSKESKSKE